MHLYTVLHEELKTACTLVRWCLAYLDLNLRWVLARLPPLASSRYAFFRCVPDVDAFMAASSRCVAEVDACKVASSCFLSGFIPVSHSPRSP
eukprot:1161225-Pelagomonas_calceolata.AAC.9